MKISEHFTLAELTHSEIAVRKNLDNTPNEKAITNLKRLAAKLEEVRTAINKPVMVNSAYRSPEVNSAVGGVKTSQHCLGCAADIRVPGYTPDEVIRIIMTAGIDYDQLILEYDAWVHISIPLSGEAWRKQALIIDKSGTRACPRKEPLVAKKPKPLRKSRTMANASVAGMVGTALAAAPAIEPAGEVVKIAQENTQGFLLVVGLAIVAFALVAAFLRYSDARKA